MPKAEKPKESQPKAVKPNTEADLNKVGVVPLTTYKDVPKVKQVEIDPQTGQKRTFFDLDGGETEVTVNTLQPFLSEEEVEKIGIYKWHAYKGNPEIFTTVVNGRRFKLTRSVFEGLKDRGLVIQDG